eukprot:93237-Prorocentrum_minimum.AAC.9
MLVLCWRNTCQTQKRLGLNNITRNTDAIITACVVLSPSRFRVRQCVVLQHSMRARGRRGKGYIHRKLLDKMAKLGNPAYTSCCCSPLLLPMW